MKRFQIALLMVLFMGFSLAFAQQMEVKEVYGDGANTIMLATGSPGELGLLNVIADAFNEDNDTNIHWVKAGSGASLKLLKNKQVDVVMVHAPADEKKAVAEGWAIKRSLIGTCLGSGLAL